MTAEAALNQFAPSESVKSNDGCQVLWVWVLVGHQFDTFLTSAFTHIPGMVLFDLGPASDVSNRN